MIEIFQSPSGKRIIAIDEDSGISAIHAVGRIMLVGTDEAIAKLRTALNTISTGRIAFSRLTPAQKEEILRLSKDGMTTSDIAMALGLNGTQVNGVVHGNKYPILSNIAKKAAKEAIPEPPMTESDKRQSMIDKIIADGRKAGHGFVQVADDINRIVGGHWLPNDVHKRIMEVER